MTVPVIISLWLNKIDLIDHLVEDWNPIVECLTWRICNWWALVHAYTFRAQNDKFALSKVGIKGLSCEWDHFCNVKWVDLVGFKVKINSIDVILSKNSCCWVGEVLHIPGIDEDLFPITILTADWEDNFLAAWMPLIDKISHFGLIELFVHWPPMDESK